MMETLFRLEPLEVVVVGVVEAKGKSIVEVGVAGAVVLVVASLTDVGVRVAGVDFINSFLLNFTDKA
jgi:hypothetical protein